MAYTELRFTDGVSTFSSPGDFRIAEYDMVGPTRNRAVVSRVTQDGEQFVAEAWENIDETISLYIDANLASTVRRLEALLLKATRIQELPIEPRVYIEVKEAGSDIWWRSEILSAQITPEPGMLDLPIYQQQIIVTFKIRRQYFWEQTADIQLTLRGRNGNSTNLLVDLRENALAVGGPAENGFYINTSEILGDLPAPVLWTINSGGQEVAVGIDVLWIGSGHRLDMTSLTFALEVENYDTLGPTINLQFDAGTSNGFFGDQQTGTSGNELFLMSWDLDATFFGVTRGNWFKPILLLQGVTHGTAAVYFRMSLEMRGVEVWSSGKILHTSGLEAMDMGAVQLPPFIMEPTEDSSVGVLKVYVQRPDGTDWTVGTDAVYLIPLDDWRVLTGQGIDLTAGYGIWDDGRENRTLVADPQDGYSPLMSARGPYLKVYPSPEQEQSTGKQWFKITAVAPDGEWNPPAQYMSMWYRPRRQTI